METGAWPSHRRVTNRKCTGNPCRALRRCHCLKMKTFSCRPLACILFVAYAASSSLAKRAVTLNTTEDRHRVKRESCQEGYDSVTGCCFCPSGFHVVKGCSENKNDTSCEECQSGTFSEHKNLEMTCEPCSRCDGKANLEVESACTPRTNTKCKCKEGHYCESEGCKVCHPCKICEDGFVVENECTPTKDTICRKKGELWWIVFIILIIAAGVGVGVGVVYFLKKRRKYCFGRASPRDSPGDNVDITENTLLKGIDLSSHLYEIVDELGPHLTKQLAVSSGMTEARIDFHMSNNQNNSKEQYYNVLKDWTEQQGLDDAFPNLIIGLRKLDKNKIADKLEKKILDKIKNNV
ncbi:hypothetical protein MATL_G00017680 [Megalops atlanticus]|uniref:Tumor necrosis factor receptor superfamily member 6 n=1 Tax=Megalops atlanticus TaxID=7932 RepID=A0A9D3QI68_MEGAT|nr:hypothetical protein MATL_G00017680 [Megalops atlanticus]